MAQINKPTDYFNTVLYTGNGTAIGSGGNAITGVGFQPDWTWIKSRTQVEEHEVFDVIRGVTKYVRPSTTQAEVTDSESLTSFDSDGFTVGNHGQVNANSQSFASWNWLASNTTSSNTDGSITSTVSANTTSGFSIGTYAGSASSITVGHGLGAIPKMIICKCTDTSATNWQVYHAGMGNGYRIYLNLTNAQELNSNAWDNTTPTSSVFTLGTAGDGNYPGRNFVFYAFAEKKGFSKFGSYTGNGSTDGTFVYTGFKPAFTILKRTDAIGGWIIVDNKRDTFNVAGKFLYAHDSGAEQDLISSHTPLDFLSNGMKMRSSNLTGTTSLNISGASYIYMAFAESPLVGTNNTPATAR